MCHPEDVPEHEGCVEQGAVLQGPLGQAADAGVLVGEVAWVGGWVGRNDERGWVVMKRRGDVGGWVGEGKEGR